MLTAIQFQGWAMPLESQPPAPPQPLVKTQTQNILINIHDGGSVVFNGDVIDIGAVRAHKLKVLTHNPQASVIVRPTFASKADILVRVMDYAHSAGVSGISILD